MRRPFGLATYGMRNEAERLRARVRELDRRLEARHQALVGVGAGVGDRVQRLGVLDDAADVVQRELRQAGVAVAGEQVLAVLPDRLVHVHARAVVADDRLGHEGRGLAVAVRDVLDDVLAGSAASRRAAPAVSNLVPISHLAGGRDFVVMHFDLDAQLLEEQAHRERMSCSESTGGTGK